MPWERKALVMLLMPTPCLWGPPLPIIQRQQPAWRSSPYPLLPLLSSSLCILLCATGSMRLALKLQAEGGKPKQGPPPSGSDQVGAALQNLLASKAGEDTSWPSFTIVLCPVNMFI